MTEDDLIIIALWAPVILISIHHFARTRQTLPAETPQAFVHILTANMIANGFLALLEMPIYVGLLFNIPLASNIIDMLNGMPIEAELAIWLSAMLSLYTATFQTNSRFLKSVSQNLDYEIIFKSRQVAVAAIIGFAAVTSGRLIGASESKILPVFILSGAAALSLALALAQSQSFRGNRTNEKIAETHFIYLFLVPFTAPLSANVIEIIATYRKLKAMLFSSVHAASQSDPATINIFQLSIFILLSVAFIPVSLGFSAFFPLTMSLENEGTIAAIVYSSLFFVIANIESNAKGFPNLIDGIAAMIAVVSIWLTASYAVPLSTYPLSLGSLTVENRFEADLIFPGATLSDLILISSALGLVASLLLILIPLKLILICGGRAHIFLYACGVILVVFSACVTGVAWLSLTRYGMPAVAQASISTVLEFMQSTSSLSSPEGEPRSASITIYNAGLAVLAPLALLNIGLGAFIYIFLRESDEKISQFLDTTRKKRLKNSWKKRIHTDRELRYAFLICFRAAPLIFGPASAMFLLISTFTLSGLVDFAKASILFFALLIRYPG